MQDNTISIIGGGNMGASIMGGLIKNGFSPQNISVADPSVERLKYLAQTFDIVTTCSNLEAAQSATIIILAVKPQQMSQVLQEMAPVIQKTKPLLISIAAGIREKSLAKWVGTDLSIIRCMPNTPALIGYGASGLYANSHVTAEERELAANILKSLGIAVWVDEENQLDTITALSGSGPAYFFYIMEIFQHAAQKLGLPEALAQQLIVQTALGAAHMALESGSSLNVLREQVTSKGGTTAAALLSLEENNLTNLLEKALIAAKKRSEELALVNDPDLAF